MLRLLYVASIFNPTFTIQPEDSNTTHRSVLNIRMLLLHFKELKYVTVLCNAEGNRWEAKENGLVCLSVTQGDVSPADDVVLEGKL